MKGLQTLFKPYEVALLVHTWESNIEERTGISTGQAYKFLQQTGESELMMSRASITVFLNKMVEEGILEYEERTGNGSRNKVYYPKMTREQFAQHVVETITRKLNEVFLEG